MRGLINNSPLLWAGRADYRLHPCGSNTRPSMKRVLLTGMSGTGTSSIIDRLVALGYRAVDLDGPLWSTYDETGD